jgi:hypothetical protein
MHLQKARHQVSKKKNLERREKRRLTGTARIQEQICECSWEVMRKKRGLAKSMEDKVLIEKTCLR